MAALVGLTVLAVIVAFAITLRTGWRPSWNWTSTSTSPPPPPPANRGGGGGCNNQTPSHSGSGGWFSSILTLAAIIAFCLLVQRWWVRPSPVQTSQQTTPAVVHVPGPCEGAWSFRTIDIPPAGIPVYLCEGWKDFPLGGGITITNPGGVVLQDEPGTPHDFGFQEDGLYVIRPNPAGSPRQVNLYNRW